ncbi:MAG: thioredoxin family protein [Deltaproteobacteria bacterium]|nr:thioredoxin family protein [Deltaproteobacteria bacterium]
MHPAPLTTSTSSTPAAAPVAITAATFPAAIARPGVVVLDCSAVWCGPCRIFAPVFAAAAARRPAIRFGTVDTDVERELAIALDIRAQPTIVVFRDGALVHKRVGAMTARKLDELLDRVSA